MKWSFWWDLVAIGLSLTSLFFMHRGTSEPRRLLGLIMFVAAFGYALVRDRLKNAKRWFYHHAHVEAVQEQLRIRMTRFPAFLQLAMLLALPPLFSICLALGITLVLTLIFQSLSMDRALTTSWAACYAALMIYSLRRLFRALRILVPGETIVLDRIANHVQRNGKTICAMTALQSVHSGPIRMAFDQEWPSLDSRCGVALQHPRGFIWLLDSAAREEAETLTLQIADFAHLKQQPLKALFFF